MFAFLRLIHTVLYGIYFAFCITLYAITTYPFFLVMWCFAKGDKVKVWRKWNVYTGRYLIFMSRPFMQVNVYGKENVKKDEAYIIVSNHLSWADVLFTALTPIDDQLYVSKTSAFEQLGGLWGKFMSHAGYIDVNKYSFEEMKDMITEKIKNKTSFVMFPEGTRSKDGKLKRFRNGTFIMSKHLNVPLLPVVIRGEGRFEESPFTGWAKFFKMPFRKLDFHILEAEYPENYESYTEMRKQMKLKYLEVLSA